MEKKNRSSVEHLVPQALIHDDIKPSNLRMWSAKEHRAFFNRLEQDERDGRMAQRASRWLDLMLEPSEVESVIGDLLEGYARRRHAPRHARMWFKWRVFWLGLYRGIDLLGRIRRAWAGK